MLNPFPELLTYSFLAITLLRITVSLLFLRWGWRIVARWRNHYIKTFHSLGFAPPFVYSGIVGSLFLLVGAFLFVGLFTQIAAGLGAASSLAALVAKQKSPELISSPGRFYLLLFIVCVSLLFLGAGAFAFDLPL